MWQDIIHSDLRPEREREWLRESPVFAKAMPFLRAVQYCSGSAVLVTESKTKKIILIVWIVILIINRWCHILKFSQVPPNELCWYLRTCELIFCVDSDSIYFFFATQSIFYSGWISTRVIQFVWSTPTLSICALEFLFHFLLSISWPWISRILVLIVEAAPGQRLSNDHSSI